MLENLDWENFPEVCGNMDARERRLGNTMHAGAPVYCKVRCIDMVDV